MNIDDDDSQIQQHSCQKNRNNTKLRIISIFMTKCKKVGSFSRKTTGTLGLKMKVVFCPDLTAQSLVKRAEVVSLIIYYHTKNIQRSWYFFYITEKYYYNVLLLQFKCIQAKKILVVKLLDAFFAISNKTSTKVP